jgi:uncharacterized protein (TIGR02300 family)
MPELKLGSKFACFSCGTKFYDLGKAEPVCPKCGANQKDAAHAETPAVSAAARRRRKADLAKVIEVDADVEPIDADVDEEVVPEEIAGADLGDDEEEEAEDFDDEE